MGSLTTVLMENVTTTKPLMSGDMNYWPLWVNVAVPIIMVSLFMISMVVLYRIPIPATPKV